MWQQMMDAGITSESMLALDFSHFSFAKDGAEGLRQQLSENYEIQIIEGPEPGYWKIMGTTRPYGISLDAKGHSGWVEFMCEVAHSHGCVFSTWAFEAPSLKQSWSNENIDTDSKLRGNQPSGC